MPSTDDNQPAITPLEVFIVDDDTDLANYIGEVAKSLGFSPQVANGAKALMALIESRRPAAIFLDVVMPDIDGVELIQWIAKHHYMVPIIVMSGYDRDYADAVEAIGRGNGAIVIGKLAKPFDITELEQYLLQIQEANA